MGYTQGINFIVGYLLIIGYSEILEEEATERSLDDFLPDLDSIKSAGRGLLSLISDVLDLTKIESGQMELHVESFAIEELFPRL